MKKLIAKLAFDAVMTAVWIILMLHPIVGAFWHEAVGLGAFALLLIHLGYNRKRIAAEVPRMFSAGAVKTTVRYLAAGFLVIGFMVTCISGILISKEILTGISAANLVFWTALHDWAAYITMALIGVHIGLHLKMIGGLFAYLLRAHPGLVTILRRCWNAAAALLIICGVFATVQYDLRSFTAASDELSQPDSQDNSLQPDSISQTQDVDSGLDEYLGSLFCTICYKCCPLNALQCSRGESVREQAVQEYYAAELPAQSDAAGEPTDDSNRDTSLPDIIAIMGLYVGGTHYVSKISKGHKKSRRA